MKKIGFLKRSVEELEYRHRYESSPRLGQVDDLEEATEARSGNLIIFASLLSLLFLFGRLLFLQVTEGSLNRTLAEGNRIQLKIIQAPRGLLLDRKGEILVRNVARFALVVYPSDLPRDEAEREKLLDLLVERLKLDRAKLDEAFAQNRPTVEPVFLAEDISREEALVFEEAISGLPAVSIIKRPSRDYPDIPGSSHLFGYVSKMSEEDREKYPSYRLFDTLGRTGLEAEYESLLRGQDGQEELEVDATGRLIRILKTREPRPGGDLRLTIDKKLLEIVGQELAIGLKSAGVGQGAVVVLDPRDGGVRALVSLPSLDANQLSRGLSQSDFEKLQNSGYPFLNRAIAGLYPPGSTVKPIVGLAALKEGIIRPETTIFDRGKITVRSIYDPAVSFDYYGYQRSGLGPVNLYSAIARSSDIYFYTIGGGYESQAGLGPEKISSYFRLFGFGQPTGIDLPGERPGLVPDPEWKERTKGEKWFLGNTYHLSIGQGDLLVTPLQLALAVASIANGGQKLEPRLSLDSLKPPQPIAGLQVEELMVIKQAMRQTVTEGSARRLARLSVEVAGKTGTAEFGGGGKTHAWMTTFWPYREPEFAMAILVEAGGEGASVAAPIAESIIRRYSLEGSN